MEEADWGPGAGVDCCEEEDGVLEGGNGRYGWEKELVGVEGTRTVDAGGASGLRNRGLGGDCEGSGQFVGMMEIGADEG